MINVDRKTLDVAAGHLAPTQLVELYKNLARIGEQALAALDPFTMPDDVESDEQAASEYTHGIEPLYLAVRGLMSDADALKTLVRYAAEANMGEEDFLAAIK